MERLHEVHHLRLRAYRFLSNYGGVGGRGGGGGNGEGEGGVRACGDGGGGGGKLTTGEELRDSSQNLIFLGNLTEYLKRQLHIVVSWKVHSSSLSLSPSYLVEALLGAGKRGEGEGYGDGDHVGDNGVYIHTNCRVLTSLVSNITSYPLTAGTTLTTAHQHVNTTTACSATAVLR